ncbi:MAG: Kef-type K+ transport system membrane component KefB [Pseudohongiellaceae bacterium]|jgi:Kef-type K+ transport system membrane component KefB
MIKSIRHKITAQLSILSSLAFGPLALLSSSGFAAVNNEAASQSSPWVWNLVIALIVISATLASAALCIAAYRNWPQKGWRLGALAPVGVLALILVIIAFARLGDNISHELWPLEIFAWAMLNMIYMVGLMTTKRIFEKADAQATAP